MVIIHANVAAVEVQHFSILMKPNVKRTPESCVQPEGKANLYFFYKNFDSWIICLVRHHKMPIY